MGDGAAAVTTGAPGANGVPEAPGVMPTPKIPGAAPKRNGMDGKFAKSAGSAPDDVGDHEFRGPGEEAKKEEKPEPPRKLKGKYKVDGEEREDEATEEELWADRRYRKAADKRFEEAAQMRKDAEGREAKLKELEEEYGKSPLKALLKKGLTPQQILDMATNDVEELLALEKRTPEQVELAKLREEKGATEKKLKDETEKKAAEAEEEALRQEIDTDAEVIGKALEACKLPKNDLVYETLTKDYYANKRHGIGKSPEEIASSTRKMVGTTLDSVLKDMSDEDVLDVFPAAAKRIAKAVRARIEKQRSSGNTVRAKPDGTPEEATPVRRRGLTELEMDYMYGLKPKPAGWKPPPGY